MEIYHVCREVQQLSPIFFALVSAFVENKKKEKIAFFWRRRNFAETETRRFRGDEILADGDAETESTETRTLIAIDIYYVYLVLNNLMKTNLFIK